MVIAGDPAAGKTGVFNEFVLVKFPDNIAVPIHLDNIKTILHTVFTAAAASACDKIAAWKNFVRHTVYAFPDVDLAPVHIHKHSAELLSLKNGIATPAFFRFEKRYTSWIDCRMTHIQLLMFSVGDAIADVVPKKILLEW